MDIKIGDYVVTSKGFAGFVVSLGPLQTGGFASFGASFRTVATVALGSKDGKKIGVSDFVENLTVLPKPGA